MKQQKYWLLIVLAVLLTFNACVQRPESSAASFEASTAVSSEETTISSQESAVVSETSSVVNSAETTINLIEQYDKDWLIQIILKETENDIIRIIGVFEYPSPDGQNMFIEIHTSESYMEADDDYNEMEEIWEGTYNYVFLNDFDHFYYKYDSYEQELVGAVWIDNDTALIATAFIVDLKTGEKRDIVKPTINYGPEGLTELHVRSGLYVEELDSLIYITDYDTVFYIFQYSLKDGTWTELAQRPFDTQYSIGSYIHFKRENVNEVSFNTEKKQRLSFNFYTKEFREIPYVGEYYEH